MKILLLYQYPIESNILQRLLYCITDIDWNKSNQYDQLEERELHHIAEGKKFPS